MRDASSANADQRGQHCGIGGIPALPEGERNEPRVEAGRQSYWHCGDRYFPSTVFLRARNSQATFLQPILLPCALRQRCNAMQAFRRTPIWCRSAASSYGECQRMTYVRSSIATQAVKTISSQMMVDSVIRFEAPFNNFAMAIIIRPTALFTNNTLAIFLPMMCRRGMTGGFREQSCRHEIRYA